MIEYRLIHGTLSITLWLRISLLSDHDRCVFYGFTPPTKTRGCWALVLILTDGDRWPKSYRDEMSPKTAPEGTALEPTGLAGDNGAGRDPPEFARIRCGNSDTVRG